MFVCECVGVFVREPVRVDVCACVRLFLTPINSPSLVTLDSPFFSSSVFPLSSRLLSLSLLSVHLCHSFSPILLHCAFYSIIHSLTVQFLSFHHLSSSPVLFFVSGSSFSFTSSCFFVSFFLYISTSSLFPLSIFYLNFLYSTTSTYHLLSILFSHLLP